MGTSIGDKVGSSVGVRVGFEVGCVLYCVAKLGEETPLPQIHFFPIS